MFLILKRQKPIDIAYTHTHKHAHNYLRREFQLNIVIKSIQKEYFNHYETNKSIYN